MLYVKTGAKKERWVGCPSMNSICEKLLDQKSIQLRLQCKAKSVQKDGKSQWELFLPGIMKNINLIDQQLHRSFSMNRVLIDSSKLTDLCHYHWVWRQAILPTWAGKTEMMDGNVGHYRHIRTQQRWHEVKK